MADRRTFLKLGALGGLAASVRSLFSLNAQGSSHHDASPLANATSSSVEHASDSSLKPVVISTWKHGVAANRAAWDVLVNGGRALDAVETGVRVTEADPASNSVGIGGFPDADGHVTLDACLMDERGRCGSVAFLQDILHPISVARRVMEETPHVMLVGDGALEFALEHGFRKHDLLTPEAEEAWREWREETGRPALPEINVENHDTIGMLALDLHGNLSGACTTSGTAFKIHGRVGDSPIIGAGLFVDNEVGAACATGWGEAVMRTAGSHLVVELMRQGRNPEDACREAVERVIRKNPDYDDIQVGFLALDRNGRTGAYAIRSGFDYALYDIAEGGRLLPSASIL